VIAYYKNYLGGIFIINGKQKYLSFKFNNFNPSGYNIWRVSEKEALKSIREGIEWDMKNNNESMIIEDEVKKIELKEVVRNLKK
jgi:hypothetical protein